MLGIIGGLIMAWILVYLKVDYMVIDFIKEVFGKNITTSMYYVGFGIIGFISNILRRN